MGGSFIKIDVGGELHVIGYVRAELTPARAVEVFRARALLPSCAQGRRIEGVPDRGADIATGRTWRDVGGGVLVYDAATIEAKIAS